MYRKLERIEVANLDFIRFFSLVRPVGHSVIPRPIRSWRCSCSRNICREKPVFAGKVTSGVRNETSGQSWPSNTVATDPFTGQNRNAKCGSGIQHKRLGGWRPKTLVRRACSTAWRCKSSSQPDRGEVIAKRKASLRGGSEGSVEQKREPMYKNRI